MQQQSKYPTWAVLPTAQNILPLSKTKSVICHQICTFYHVISIYKFSDIAKCEWPVEWLYCGDRPVTHISQLSNKMCPHHRKPHRTHSNICLAKWKMNFTEKQRTCPFALLFDLLFIKSTWSDKIHKKTNPHNLGSPPIQHVF